MKIIFKAQIKKGAAVYQDHRFYKWPDAGHPRDGRCEHDAIFNVEFENGSFRCWRHGYGDLESRRAGGYGNGRLFLRDINDLICEPEDRERVISAMRADKQKKIDSAVSELVSLEKQLAELR